MIGSTNTKYCNLENEYEQEQLAKNRFPSERSGPQRIAMGSLSMDKQGRYGKRAMAERYINRPITILPEYSMNTDQNSARNSPLKSTPDAQTTYKCVKPGIAAKLYLTSPASSVSTIVHENAGSLHADDCSHVRILLGNESYWGLKQRLMNTTTLYALWYNGACPAKA